MSCYKTFEYKGIRCDINEGGARIYDSWKVSDDAIKEEFLTRLCLENEGLELARSRKSMLTEWKAHNIMYRMHLFRKSTEHTDLEWDQGRFVAFLYKAICFLFRENV